MKKVILLIAFLYSVSCLSQEREKGKFVFSDFVECYYSENATESISIYENPNENKVAELNSLTERHCWYKFAISESKNGWLKIENIMLLPGCENHILNKDIEKFKGKWVQSKNMLLSIGSHGDTKISCANNDKENPRFKYSFYSKPNSNSEISFCVKGYAEFELLAVENTWAKLKIEYKGKFYVGWLPRKHQCPYPWTTCPVFD